MRHILPCIACVAAISSPSNAEVRSASAAAFELQTKATVRATPEVVYARIGRIGDWWDPAHSYSGKASNLTLELRAGGCFCEAIAGGGVQHMRVVNAQPGSLVRLEGALGPLQAYSVTGVLTWSLKAIDGGTEITQTYQVAGPIEGGADKIAPMVDQVLSAQFQRLADSLNR